MNYRDKILDYYKILLAIGWLQADEDGNVSLVIGDDVRAATVDGKRVVIPTRDQMKNRDWSNRIGFHPLRESYNLGISDVLANLRDQFVQRLNTSIAYLFKELVAIANDQSNQKNLDSEQAAVLDALKHVSAKTVSSYEDLQKKTRARNDTDQFINIFIRKGGMVNGQTYGRAAIVSFPIYQKLLEGEEKINGVKISGKDRDMLIKLFQFVFPTIDDKESFNVGINTKTAPWLEALVRATFGVVDQLVESSKPYMQLVGAPSILEFPEDMGTWIEIFDNKELVERLAGSIPSLTRGDEGAEELEERKSEPTRSGTRETPKQQTTETVEKTTMTTETERPRGRMTLGAPASSVQDNSLGKAKPGQDSASGSDRARHTVARDSDIDREEARRRREQEDRERRQREREEEAERERRRREQEEDDREYRERKRQLERELDDLDRGRGRSSSRDSRDDRSRDRDYRDDRRRDDGRTRNTGDIFEDNPVLRSNLRDEERDSRYSRDRDSRRRDPRDMRYRDDRDYRDDRYYDDRYDRGRDPRSRYRR